MQSYIAILGFGYQPPEANLAMAEQAVTRLVSKGKGIAVGNLTGTFAAALKQAEAVVGDSIAVIDESMLALDRPETTQVVKVGEAEKHSVIAERAAGGLIIGGGKGTLKLVDCFVALGKPMAAISGSGGVVDDGALPKEVVLFDTVESAIDYL